MKYLLLIMVFALVGCTSSAGTYEQGLESIDAIHSTYGVDYRSIPNNATQITLMREQFEALQSTLEKTDGTTPVHLLIDYRIALLQAGEYEREGFKWGRGSTTEPGFGCRKGSERILNSSMLRNQSAQYGYAASDVLVSFIEQYPVQAQALELTLPFAVSIRANYQIIENQVIVDRKRINSLCKEEE